MEKDYNKIDDFFKQAFEGADANPEEAEWNVPSDEVWAGLKSATASEPKARPLLSYWKRAAVAASLLLLLVAGQAIYQRIQLDQQAAKIKTIEEKLQDLETQKVEESTEIELDEGVKVESSTSGNLEKINPVIERSIAEVFDSASSKSEIIVGKTKVSEKRKETSKDGFVEVKGSGTKENILVANDDVVSVENEARNENIVDAEMPEKLKIDALTTLNSELSLLALETNSSLVLPNFNRVAVQASEKMPASLTAYFSPVQYNQTFDQRRRTLFQNNVIGEQSFAAGLQYILLLNQHFYLETGIGYARSVAQREHRPPTKYQRSGERPNNRGDLENDYNFTLFTSGNVIETDVVVSRAADTNLENGRELDVRVFSNSIIEQLQIPLLLGFQTQIKRLRWDLKLGVIANPTLQGKVEIDEIRLNEARLNIKEVKDTRTRSTRQKNELDVQFYTSTALSYQLQEHWALQIEPYFSTATRVKRDPNPIIRNARIRTQSAGVKLGLRYDF